MTDSVPLGCEGTLVKHNNKYKTNQDVIQKALDDIEGYVGTSKDKERAIRTLLGFCLKRKLAPPCLKVFTYLKSMPQLSKDTSRMLTGLLHLLVEHNNEAPNNSMDVAAVFEFLKTKKVVTESAYAVLIKHHSMNDPEAALTIISDMKGLNIRPHLRSYRVLLECAPDLAYLNKVYQLLLDDIASFGSNDIKVTDNPDAELYDDSSDEPVLNQDHLVPDIDTFLAIFTNLQKFKGDVKANTIEYYLLEYSKYHTTLDPRMASVIDGIVSVDIESDGKIKGHPYKLESIDISKEQQNELLTVLYDQNPKTFKAFDSFMAKNGKYDVVLDGANIALYNNTDFLAWKVIKAVLAYFKKGKRVLIVLSHKRRDPELIQFVGENKGKVDIYWAGAGVYDDLVWLYASIQAGCPLVTNDKMADHIYYVFPTEKGSPPVFKVWMERHQVTYDFNAKGQFQLREPTAYSCRIQCFPKQSENTTEKGQVWVLPIMEEVDGTISYRWIMANFVC